MNDLEAGFFEDALDGCGCIVKLALGFLVGVLIIEVLFQPWFWPALAIVIVGWMLHRAVARAPG